jgi:hypothetical protein
VQNDDVLVSKNLSQFDCFISNYHKFRRKITSTVYFFYVSSNKPKKNSWPVFLKIEYVANEHLIN